MHNHWDKLEANPAAIQTLSRETCLQLLAWNDRNGVWSDKDAIAEGMAPLTLAQSRAFLHYGVTGIGEVQDIMEMTE